MENFIGILTTNEKDFELIRLLHSSVAVIKIQDSLNLIFDKRCIGIIVDSSNYNNLISFATSKIAKPIIVYPSFSDNSEYLNICTNLNLIASSNFKNEKLLGDDIYMLAKGVYFSIEQHSIITPETVHLLTNLEFRLLYILLKNRNKVNSVSFLMERLDLMSTSSLYVCVKKIRDKIEKNPANPGLLINDNKLGYRLNTPILNEL